MASEEKEALKLGKELVKALNKDKKEKIAWSLGRDQDDPTTVRDWVSTGSTILDYLIGNARGKGIPAGKITEICGEEATGKSLMIMRILANVQKKGGLAVLFDEENALTPDFAQRIGLDLEKLVYIQAGCVENVGENIEKIITLAAAKDVKQMIAIGWDSIAATPPEAELKGDYDPQSIMGLQAKALAKMTRKLTKMVGAERVTLVVTNQLKMKVGVMFGDPFFTPGGKAIPYHASVRIRLNKVTKPGTKSPLLSDKMEQVYGVHTKCKVFKNRLGPPMRACEFDIMFADGIDDASSVREYILDRNEDVERSQGKMVWKTMPPELAKSMADAKFGTYNKEEKKFRLDPENFRKHWEGHKEFREYVFSLLDKYLIVTWDNVHDAEMSEDSVLDVEAAVAEVA